MDLADFIPYYPYVDDTNFNKVIFSKKELRDIKILPVERFPENKGDLLSHQILLSRLLSSYTPYDGMLLFHEMGTGKSCTVVGAIKKILSEKNGIDSYIYVASNVGLLANFKDEMEKCSGDDKLSDKGTRQTTYTFIKNYTDYPGRLNNKVIVIDEVHNVRESGSMYESLYSILHNVKNCKILLLSGTPMMNEPDEIASIINLILPLDKQLNYKAFNATFFKKGKLVNDGLLREAFKGRVSYLKAMMSGVRQNFIGNMFTKNGKFKLDSSVMEDFQTEAYKTILIAEKNGKDVAHSQSLSASDMALPITRFTKAAEIVPEIFKGIQQNDNKAKIKALRKYSCKYADSIETILEAKDKQKSVFVFNERVNQPGGLKMFALILNNFGFGEYTEMNQHLTTKKERYILMTGEEEISNHNNFVRDAFNQPRNSKGEYIRVILASSAISEGYSFQNVQVIDIHSPWFNFSKIAQAIARGIRAGSHRQIMKDLNVSILKGLDVDIHLRVSIPNQADIESIDVMVYNTAETKDLMIKQIEHVIKEEAIDAMFNFERNKRESEEDLNLSRDCDYTICKYKPFPNEDITSSELDCSTFLAYYNGNYFECERKIIDWFEHKSSMTFTEMLKDGYKDKRTVLLWTLNHIINTNTVVRIKYTKIPCYLREENDTYFLVYDFAVNKSKQIDSYYVTDTHFAPTTNKQVLPKKNLCDTINLICKAKTVKSLNFQMRTLTTQEKEEVLESNLLEEKSEVINKKFEGQYGEIDDVMYSWYLLQEEKKARKMVDDSWEDCTDDDMDTINEELKRRKNVVIENAKKLFAAGAGVYYGMYVYTDEWLDEDDKTRPFIFKLVKYAAEESTDKRKKLRGQNCSTISLGDLKAIATSLGLVTTQSDTVLSLCNKIKKKFIEGNAMLRD